MRYFSTRHPTRLLSAAAMFALAGCKTFTPDGGMSPVAELAGDTLRKDVVAIRNESVAVAAYSDVQRLLARPLTADAAVQIALLNNRGLQAAYNKLGIAEARAVGASLPPNPTLLARAHRRAGRDRNRERASSADILALATLPARAEIAADRFRQAQLRGGRGNAAHRSRYAARVLSRGRGTRARELS